MIRRVVLTVAVMLTATSAAHGAFPRLMNFQGRLDDTGGVPLPDADYSVTFRLFDVPTGGASLWQEAQTVATTAGVFSALLGTLDTIPEYIFYRDSLYLEIQPQGSDVVLPRTRLTIVPWAYHAHDADKVGGADAITLEESAEIDAKIAAHTANPNAHHTKTVDASELIIGTLSEGRLPQGAIDSTELELESIAANRLVDEAGLMTAYTNLVLLSTTMVVIDSAVITVPKAGYAIFIASGWFYKLHTSGFGDSFATVSLSGSRIAHEDNHTAKFTILSNAPSGHYTDNFTLTRVLQIGAGQTKVFLIGDMSGTGNPRVEKVHVSALYVPSAYGNVEVSGQQ